MAALSSALRARHQRALAHAQRGDHELAVEQWRHVVQQDPLFAEARIGLVRTLISSGRLDEAEAEARQMSRHLELYGPAMVIRAQVAEQRGELAEARHCLEDGARYAPTDVDVLRALARFLFQHGPIAEIEGALRELLRRRPDDGQALFNLGTFYLATERYELAVAAYRTLLGIQPKHAMAHWNLGFALAALGQDEAAQDAFRVARRSAVDDVPSQTDRRPTWLQNQRDPPF